MILGKGKVSKREVVGLEVFIRTTIVSQQSGQRCTTGERQEALVVLLRYRRTAMEEFGNLRNALLRHLGSYSCGPRLEDRDGGESGLRLHIRPHDFGIGKNNLHNRVCYGCKITAMWGSVQEKNAKRRCSSR